ncbi:hypothetical protein B0H11DRAFT_2071880 [Mycena galericulata]|nr:hypothetical protein B0H11DRAFT_2071880 [Mycena galericulata]
MDISANVLLLASSWLNVSLYTLELALCRRYFQRPNRPLLYRLGVGAFIFFDTICTLTICINVSFVVLNLPLEKNPIADVAPTAIVIISTYCTAAVEQAILCHLFFILSRNVFVTGFIGLVVLAHLGLALSSGGLIFTLDSELNAALSTATAASITCAAADICISISLASRVWRMISPSDVLPASHSFVRKFLMLIVSSGLIVATNTLVMMGLLLKHSNAFDFFFSCQGRVYSVTLLANFLVGIHFRQDMSTDMSTQSRRPPSHSIVTGVVFDVIEGYDTESRSHNRRRLDTSTKTETEPPAHRASEERAVPYNYNLDEEWLRLKPRASLRVRSEP